MMISNQPAFPWTATRRQTIALISAYVAVYVLLDWLSDLRGITPWNPQAGLTLTLLMAAGPTFGIWTVIAALLAELIVRSATATWQSLVLVPLLIASGYTLAAYVLRRRHVSTDIEWPEQVLPLICVIVPMTLLVSTLYVMLIAPVHAFSSDDMIRYWVGDMNGVLSITPLLLAVRHWRAGLRSMWQRRWEVIMQLASILSALWLRLVPHGINDLIYLYPLFVPVIWIAFRWGVVGTAVCVLMFQIALIVAAHGYANDALLINMQFLAVTLGTTGLLLGSVVSSRVAALRRVATQAAEQRAILTTAPDAVVAVNAETQIVSVNRAAVQLFELTEHELVGQPLAQRLPKLQLNTTNGRATLDGLRGDDSFVPVDVAWALLDAPDAEGYILIIRDVTERLANEALLRERDTVLARAMRFAVVGEFASAVTHELNQPITALVSYLRASQILAAPVKDQDTRLMETLDKAAREAIRTADALRRLRDFYRGGTPQLTAVDVEEVTTSVLKTYEDRLRQQNVQLDSLYEISLPAVMADRTQIEMILHNLLNNAIDAVAAGPLTNRKIALNATHRQTDVVVTIDDSGAGVSPEILASLFDPFVTTKPTGMGLGLAISRSLLRSHGGDLWTEPGPFTGARFVVRMPITTSAQIAL